MNQLVANDCSLKAHLRHCKKKYDNELRSMDQEHFADITALEDLNRELRRQLREYEDRSYSNNNTIIAKEDKTTSSDTTNMDMNNSMEFRTWEQLEAYARSNHKYAIREARK